MVGRRTVARAAQGTTIAPTSVLSHHPDDAEKKSTDQRFEVRAEGATQEFRQRGCEVRGAEHGKRAVASVANEF